MITVLTFVLSFAEVIDKSANQYWMAKWDASRHIIPLLHNHREHINIYHDVIEGWKKTGRPICHKMEEWMIFKTNNGYTMLHEVQGKWEMKQFSTWKEVERELNSLPSEIKREVKRIARRRFGFIETGDDNDNDDSNWRGYEMKVEYYDRMMIPFGVFLKGFIIKGFIIFMVLIFLLRLKTVLT